MRVAQPIVLKEEVRRKLEQQSRGRSRAARVVMRSRIILLANDGLQNKQIAEKLQIAPRMVDAVARAVPQVGHGRSAERCAPPWTHPIDLCRVDCGPDCKNHSKYAHQRHAMVYAHHGQGNEHFKGFGVAHLAGQRPEAASRGEFQGEQRS